MISWFLKKTVGDNKVTKSVLILTAIGLCAFGIGYMFKGAAHLVNEIDEIDSKKENQVK